MKPYNSVMHNRWEELHEAVQNWQESIQVEIPAPLYRILHIEDSPFDSKWFMAVMKKTSAILDQCEFVHTKTLTKALKLLHREPFDLVVTDLVLPDSVKGEAVRALADSYPAIPTLVLTSSDEPSVAVDCIQKGARDYFVKQRTRGDDLARAMKFAMTIRG